jgi:HAD superfamily hydrolase (TIGR01509 family)
MSSWIVKVVRGVIVFGAVWDLDGTLVDTEMNHFAAWGTLLREHGRDLTHEEFRPTFGLRNDDILVHHFGFAAGEYSIAALGERKEELYRASLVNDGVRMQAGARQLVEHFHSLGSQQAIASSAPPANIDLTMHLIGLRGYFDAIVSSEEVTRGKPAPDLILRAAERLNLPPSRLVVLEDAPAGIAAGRAAGSRVIAIAATFPTETLSAADLIVHSFTEVMWPKEQWKAFFTS